MRIFKIKRSVNSQFYWVLDAGNGEPILKSETYKHKQDCQDGIASSRRSIGDINFKRLIAGNNQYYFNQVASNGKILGTSEMYDSGQSCEKGIAAVKHDAPLAIVQDLTI